MKKPTTGPCARLLKMGPSTTVRAADGAVKRVGSPGATVPLDLPPPQSPLGPPSERVASWNANGGFLRAYIPSRCQLEKAEIEYAPPPFGYV